MLPPMSQQVFPPEQDATLRRMAGADNYNAWLVDRGLPHYGDRVLDLGAGIGTFTALLAQRAKQVVALEPDPAFHPALERRFGESDSVSVLPVGAESLTPEAVGEPFDSVVCFNVLEHIEDDLGTLRGVRSVLRPGGRLLLLVPAHPQLYGAVDRAVAHCRRYRRSQLGKLINDAGMSPREVRYVNPVGAAGWLVSSRLRQRAEIPGGPLAAYDRVVPLLRQLDRLRLPFGLSVWAVAQRD